MIRYRTWVLTQSCFIFTQLFIVDCFRAHFLRRRQDLEFSDGLCEGGDGDKRLIRSLATNVVLQV